MGRWPQGGVAHDKLGAAGFILAWLEAIAELRLGADPASEGPTALLNGVLKIDAPTPTPAVPI